VRAPWAPPALRLLPCCAVCALFEPQVKPAVSVRVSVLLSNGQKLAEASSTWNLSSDGWMRELKLDADQSHHLLVDARTICGANSARIRSVS
jgi:hypothetical protein